jgi:hypothetical protein
LSVDGDSGLSLQVAPCAQESTAEANH